MSGALPEIIISGRRTPRRSTWRAPAKRTWRPPRRTVATAARSASNGGVRSVAGRVLGKLALPVAIGSTLYDIGESLNNRYKGEQWKKSIANQTEIDLKNAAFDAQHPLPEASPRAFAQSASLSSQPLKSVSELAEVVITGKALQPIGSTQPTSALTKQAKQSLSSLLGKSQPKQSKRYGRSRIRSPFTDPNYRNPDQRRLTGNKNWMLGSVSNPELGLALSPQIAEETDPCKKARARERERRKQCPARGYRLVCTHWSKRKCL